MDASLCREQLQRMLAVENGLLAKLETLLDTEHAFIADDDIEALEQAGQSRQSCMVELVRLEDERRSLCRMLGKKPDLSGLEELLKWCDPKGSLQAQWKECAERATRCRSLNDRNGIIVTARLKRVEGLLNIVTGRTQAPATYGRQGAYASVPVGRMIRSEA
jgi:flagellar biosynthesis/type III secretory pathway chaperone